MGKRCRKRTLADDVVGMWVFGGTQGGCFGSFGWHAWRIVVVLMLVVVVVVASFGGDFCQVGGRNQSLGGQFSWRVQQN